MRLHGCWYWVSTDERTSRHVEATALAAGQVQGLVQASDTDASLYTWLLSGVSDGHLHI